MGRPGLFTTGLANALAASFTATLDRATVAVGEKRCPYPEF
jgi:hypothetical protein